MSKSIKVVVTGAAGQIAYSLIPRLVDGKTFGDKIVNLALVEIPQVVDKLEGLVSFANPITFTPDISSVTMSFNLGEGMSLHQAGANVINIGSGPFQAIFTTN